MQTNRRALLQGSTGAALLAPFLALEKAMAAEAAKAAPAASPGLMLQAEYHPQPPFPGGTPATATADVAKMMDDMFAPAAAQFKALAK